MGDQATFDFNSSYLKQHLLNTLDFNFSRVLLISSIHSKVYEGVVVVVVEKSRGISMIPTTKLTILMACTSVISIGC